MSLLLFNLILFSLSSRPEYLFPFPLFLRKIRNVQTTASFLIDRILTPLIQTTCVAPSSYGYATTQFPGACNCAVMLDTPFRKRRKRQIHLQPQRRINVGFGSNQGQFLICYVVVYVIGFVIETCELLCRPICSWRLVLISGITEAYCEQS